MLPIQRARRRAMRATASMIGRNSGRYTARGGGRNSGSSGG